MAFVRSLLSSLLLTSEFIVFLASHPVENYYKNVLVFKLCQTHTYKYAYVNVKQCKSYYHNFFCENLFSSFVVIFLDAMNVLTNKTYNHSVSQITLTHVSKHGFFRYPIDLLGKCHWYAKVNTKLYFMHLTKNSFFLFS